MAISLNNHETRIKALEDGVGMKYKVLFSGTSQSSDSGKTYSLSEPWNNYDILIIQHCQGDVKDDWRQEWFFTKFLKTVTSTSVSQDGTYVYNAWYIDNQDLQPAFLNDHVRIKFTSAKQTVVREIIGLKLCYNFSYNIYNKFYFVKFTLVRLFVQQYNRKTFYNAFKCYLDSLSHKRGVNRCLNKETC